MKRFLEFAILVMAFPMVAQADESSTQGLAFSREVINRYSLDHLPRSISIRQGDNVWLGYDLQRAKLYKSWQAPEGAAGLKASGFLVRSVGKTWYEDTSDETWQLRRKGEVAGEEAGEEAGVEKISTLTIRYLGCSQREGHFELSWELRHDAGTLTLRERVPMTAPSSAERVAREIRVEPLAAGEELVVPKPARKAWKMTTDDGTAAATLSSTAWHRLTLP